MRIQKKLLDLKSSEATSPLTLGGIYCHEQAEDFVNANLTQDTNGNAN